MFVCFLFRFPYGSSAKREFRAWKALFSRDRSPAYQERRLNSFFHRCFSFLSGRVMSRHLAAGFLLRALPTLATSEETRVGKHAETAKHGSLRQTSEFTRFFIEHAEGGACARLRASSGYLGAAQKQNTAQRGPGTAIRRRRRRRRFPSRPVAAEAQIGCVPAEKPGVPLLMARAR